MTKFSKYLIGFTGTKKKARTAKVAPPKKGRTVKVYDCPREQAAREKNRERCLKYYHANKTKKDDE